MYLLYWSNLLKNYFEFVPAKVVVELSKYAYVQAAVLLHPSFVAVDDMHGMTLLLVSILHLLFVDECTKLGMFRHNFHIGLGRLFNKQFLSMPSLSCFSYFGQVGRR